MNNDENGKLTEKEAGIANDTKLLKDEIAITITTMREESKNDAPNANDKKIHSNQAPNQVG